jgi:hypothetical protein
MVNKSLRGQMNPKLIDAVWSMIKARHDEEMQLLARSQHDDVVQLENLFGSMDKRWARLNSLPDEQLDIRDQLPQMTKNWSRHPNGGYQQ